MFAGGWNTPSPCPLPLKGERVKNTNAPPLAQGGDENNGGGEDNFWIPSPYLSPSLPKGEGQAAKSHWNCAAAWNPLPLWGEGQKPNTPGAQTPLTRRFAPPSPQGARVISAVLP
jgi:hypothetical protein